MEVQISKIYRKKNTLGTQNIYTLKNSFHTSFPIHQTLKKQLFSYDADEASPEAVQFSNNLLAEHAHLFVGPGDVPPTALFRIRPSLQATNTKVYRGWTGS